MTGRKGILNLYHCMIVVYKVDFKVLSFQWKCKSKEERKKSIGGKNDSYNRPTRCTIQTPTYGGGWK
jgi:hypothetical protein